jgi:hypothetical protein
MLLAESELRECGDGCAAPVSVCRHRSVRAGLAADGLWAAVYFSLSKLLTTNPTFAGRSPSRRMKYGNQSLPNGT